MGQGRINFGFATYNYPVAEILEMARTAEDLGFTTFWIGEHYVVPSQYVSNHPAKLSHQLALSSEHELWDPLPVLAAVSVSTKRLKIGTSITIVPLNNPLILARATMTMHALTGGRFQLGIGSGWLREEFEALGLPFDNRGSRMDETLEILKKAWKGGFFEHEGKHFRFPSVMILPYATDIPIICGGNSDRALKRAAAIGDGWINSSVFELDEAARARDQIEKWRTKLGTSDRAFTYYLRPANTTAQGILALTREGFDNFIIQAPNVWPPGNSVSLAQKRAALKQLADALEITTSP